MQLEFILQYFAKLGQAIYRPENRQAIMKTTMTTMMMTLKTMTTTTTMKTMTTITTMTTTTTTPMTTKQFFKF